MTKLNQMKKLAAWLHEWQIDQCLQGDTAWPPAPLVDVDGTPQNGQTKRVVYQLPHADTLAIGKIVLLKPLSPTTHARPVYLLAMCAGRGKETVTVVPFSRFAHPAVPDEYSTALSPAPLQVLALWNRCEVLRHHLVRYAWPVSQLAGQNLQRVLHPAAEQGGPPLIHPLDPRHDYLDQERTLWPEWHAAIADYISGATRVEERSHTDLWSNELAAENTDTPYGDDV